MSDAGETDESLIERYAGGEVAAFDILYHRHEMRIWRYLMRQVGNRATAEELMQEVWFAVARDAPRFQPRARFTTWLFTVARNRMLDAVRSSRRTLSLEAVGYESGALLGRLSTEPGSGPLAAAMVHDEHGALAAALAQLPAEQRDAFLLQVEGELSIEEVAGVTRSSFETTKSRLRYARSKLRGLLREHA
jgi:RNA polymerase sigma-70 factor (ECF subfamily)